MAGYFIPGYRPEQGSGPIIDFFGRCRKKRLCQRCLDIERKNAERRVAKQISFDEVAIAEKEINHGLSTIVIVKKI